MKISELLSKAFPVRFILFRCCSSLDSPDGVHWKFTRWRSAQKLIDQIFFYLTVYRSDVYLYSLWFLLFHKSSHLSKLFFLSARRVESMFTRQTTIPGSGKSILSNCIIRWTLGGDKFSQGILGSSIKMKSLWKLMTFNGKNAGINHQWAKEMFMSFLISVLSAPMH